MATNFQKWLTDHNPEDKMLWKRSFWDTYIFWRDTICPLFVPYLPSKIGSDIDQHIDWNERRFNKHVHVVGTHWSKSIEKPGAQDRLLWSQARLPIQLL